MPVTGSSCQVTGLAEGEAQHFEVVAVYQALDGTEMCSAAEVINAIPRSEAKPIPKLRHAAGPGRRSGPDPGVLDAGRPVRGADHAVGQPAAVASAPG